MYLSYEYQSTHYISNAIKNKMTNAAMLRYDNLVKPPVVQKYAILKGFGVVLLQDGHLIYSTIDCLQLHRKSHMAIELQALAIPWAYGKFNHSCMVSNFKLRLTTNH